ncbi:RCC1 domain-containing protein [Xylanivirga thermophila]|uniref:RCC1 domain-containing protein n=1 Tax=Xylanivirga thermophila TaxID=2496273 RepID=UPI00101BDA28|nr:hypothetical protein [Xylanivirga thermophila]
MKTKQKIIIAFLLAMVLIPVNIKVHAYELKAPKRVRANNETVWNPENLRGTISGGNCFSLFLTGTNTIKAIGANSSGQLGDGSTTGTKIDFVDVLGENGIGFLTDVVQIDTGEYHSMALKSDGTVWSWGRNSSGQLGDGGTTNRSTPVQVKGLADIVQISAGGSHSMALKSDGTVWTWGQNNHGVLGDGGTTNRSTPVQVKGLADIVQISAGGSHSMALKSDGTVWTWGENYGQIGDGTTEERHTPVQVVYKPNISLLTDIVQISAGHSHSMALKSDGTVWAWGCGMVGDGSIYGQYSPVQVNDLTDVVQISAGDYHSVALKSDGTIWSWGRNSDGELGDGSTTDRSTPIQICFEGQRRATIIPQHMLYKFNKPKERNIYEGGKSQPIEWELISKSVESFDIYYAPCKNWTDKNTWNVIEKDVSISSLSPESFTSNIDDGKGGFLEGTRYKYLWTLPNEFISHIRIIVVPKYK